MTFIESLKLTSFTNGEHFDYLFTLMGWIAENKLPSKLSPLTKALTDALSQEESALATSRKSPLSVLIQQADAERDIYLRNLRHITTTTMHIADDAAAATIIHQLFTDYNTLRPNMNRNDESGLLINFIADLEGKAADAVAALGLEGMVKKLKAANDRVVELTRNRDNDKSHQVAGIMNKMRLQADEAYHNFVLTVNALVVVEDPTPYLGLIDFMNTLITRTKRQSLKQKAKAPDNNQGDNAGDNNPGEEEPPQG
ncbi:MAG: DUF6261 family protein [Prevotellaceae bacterium]|jgi:hypothetical protein|nr:DUF6261 family protein [Prevotellaceae bacterium]